MNNCLDNMVNEVRAAGPTSLRAAARLMTMITDHPHRLAELLAASHDWPQPRLVLGVTGAPGTGKSTLVDHLATEFRTRRPDRRLGVIAVDPSSPFTGGALLGDRVRMMRHATDPGVFIRSLASRGRLGGLALGVRGVVQVMGLIGCDVVVIETVGVGQSEVEIAQLADKVAVVLAPGQGDSVQMLKAGLLEAGDLFVINKSDRDGAGQLRQQLMATFELCRLARRDLGESATEPAVFSCSAVTHEGVPELADALDVVAAEQARAGHADRGRQAIEEIRLAVRESVGRRVDEVLGANGSARGRLLQVLRGDVSLDRFVDLLLHETARCVAPPHWIDQPHVERSQRSVVEARSEEQR